MNLVLNLSLLVLKEAISGKKYLELASSSCESDAFKTRFTQLRKALFGFHNHPRRLCVENSTFSNESASLKLGLSHFVMKQGQPIFLFSLSVNP